MQVSSPPPTGSAGQHHQVELGEESTPCEHTAYYFQYLASLVPFKPCFLKVTPVPQVLSCKSVCVTLTSPGDANLFWWSCQ